MTVFLILTGYWIRNFYWIRLNKNKVQLISNCYIRTKFSRNLIYIGYLGCIALWVSKVSKVFIMRYAVHASIETKLVLGKNQSKKYYYVRGLLGDVGKKKHSDKSMKNNNPREKF